MQRPGAKQKTAFGGRARILIEAVNNFKARLGEYLHQQKVFEHIPRECLVLQKKSMSRKREERTASCFYQTLFLPKRVTILHEKK